MLPYAWSWGSQQCLNRKSSIFWQEGQTSRLPAVILAGGLGTRLRPVVNDRPNLMAMVAGRPFGEWLVIGLQSVGVRHLVFCTSYLGEMVQ